MLNISDLQLKSIQELHELLHAKREELRTLTFSVSENQLKNVRSIREAGKDIARILGVLNGKRTLASKT